MSQGDSIDLRLRSSGVLVIAGLLVEALCLVWSGPISFIVFVGVGGALIATGVLFFFYSLASAVPGNTNSSGDAR